MEQQILISLPLEEFEEKMKNIVSSAVVKALSEKEPPKYYTLQEAHVRTGKAISTLYTDHCKGKLKAFKSGRHLRFSEQQLVDYLEGR